MDNRSLQYKDRFVTKLVQSLTARFDDYPDMPDLPFTDLDTRLWVSYFINQLEYTKILSSLDIGADLKFGEESHELHYIMAVPMAICEAIADCIETDAEVSAALLAYLGSKGYMPSETSSGIPTPVQLTNEQVTNNILEGVTDCSNPAVNMAIARSIVRELNETVQDVFDNLELATNLNEAAGIVLGAVPVAGTGAAAIELVDWVQQTVVETYTAAYNQSSEDEIACAIFCHIETDCEVSLDSLLAIYEDLGSITVPPIETIDDLINFIVTTTMSIDVTGVAIFHYFLLHALKFGGVVFELAGFNDLAYIIKNAAEFRDFSFDQCTDCPPTVATKNFWRIYKDFALDENNWVHDNNNGEYIQGAGIQSRVGLSTGAVTVAQTSDIGLDSASANWKIKALFQENYVADPNNSGAQDFCAQEGWSGANFTGTLSSLGNATLGVSSYKPATYRGATAGASFFNGRSFRFTRAARGGTSNLTTLVARLTRVVIVGMPGTSGDKPALAEWWRDTLPATPAEFFDD